MVGFLLSKKLRPLESFTGGRDICYYFYYLILLDILLIFWLNYGAVDFLFGI